MQMGAVAVVGGLVFALAACPAGGRTVKPAPVLRIDENEGCVFSPQINRALALVPRHGDMQRQFHRQAIRFGFERLHGLGVARMEDAELGEDRLYFRENTRSLIETLRRLGVHVDRQGRIIAPDQLKESGSAFYARVGATAPRGENHLAGAQSYFVCGGT